MSILPERLAEKTMLDTVDLSLILNQPIATIRGHLRAGRIPGAIRIGKNYRVSRVIFEDAVRNGWCVPE